MAHDFERFPELTNSQMDFYYFSSPHKQIFEDFVAEVTKVVDGDTIRVRCGFRDFEFPIRFLGTNAKEMSEGGEDAKSFLENLLLGEEVYIIVDKTQRVGKWGRLLGRINHKGIDVNAMMIMQGRSTTFDARDEGKIPNINKTLRMEQWF